MQSLGKLTSHPERYQQLRVMSDFALTVEQARRRFDRHVRRFRRIATRAPSVTTREFADALQQPAVARQTARPGRKDSRLSPCVGAVDPADGASCSSERQLASRLTAELTIATVALR